MACRWSRCPADGLSRQPDGTRALQAQRRKSGRTGFRPCNAFRPYRRSAHWRCVPCRGRGWPRCPAWRLRRGPCAECRCGRNVVARNRDRIWATRSTSRTATPTKRRTATSMMAQSGRAGSDSLFDRWGRHRLEPARPAASLSGIKTLLSIFPAGPRRNCPFAPGRPGECPARDELPCNLAPRVVNPSPTIGRPVPVADGCTLVRKSCPDGVVNKVRLSGETHLGPTRRNPSNHRSCSPPTAAWHGGRSRHWRALSPWRRSARTTATVCRSCRAAHHECVGRASCAGSAPPGMDPAGWHPPSTGSMPGKARHSNGMRYPRGRAALRVGLCHEACAAG